MWTWVNSRFFGRLLFAGVLVLGVAQVQLYAQDYDDEDDMAMDPYEDDFDPADLEDNVRTPPAPPSPGDFNRGGRFGGPGGLSPRGRGGSRGGGGEDRLGRTEGVIEFRLVDPPQYYLRPNRPYMKKNQVR